MTIVLAYCRRDIIQAKRLMVWMGFLSVQHGHSMKKERIILIPSRHASGYRTHRTIERLAQKIFGEVVVWIPGTEDERPWPYSPNFMFGQALRLAESRMEDFLWMEPDAIPLKPDWFDRYKSEWQQAKAKGKLFMGTHIPIDPHMSGIGVYSCEWRSVAPALARAESVPWDLDARTEVVPHAHFVSLSQHIWNNPVITPTFLDAVVDPRAVIFHQDKSGELIRHLDERDYGGVLAKVLKTKDEAMDRKYYYADNCSRARVSRGYTFRFEPYEQFAGSWRGVYSTDNEGEQLALAALIATGSVNELTESEYEERAKKKAGNLNGSAYSNLQPSTSTQGQIKGDRAAVVNAEPATATTPQEGKVLEESDLDRILQVGSVEIERPAEGDTPPVRSKLRKKKP